MKESMIHAYAAQRAGAPLEPYRFAANSLGPLDVEITISHCGICHSDLHLIDNDWSVSSYPLVPGHEIIGSVSRLGTEVAQLHEGQRVGVGWLAGSCMACEQCLSGNENLCRRSQPTCIARPGGYASHVRVDARFAAAIPDSLPSEWAAPLLCAGITVFAPLQRQKLKAASRVGVIGLGGLGHLAAQFAKAMGFAVTVFSTSAQKQDEAYGFGADRFVDSSASGALSGAASSCDMILTTVPVDLSWPEYLNLLKPNGHLCIVGASPGEVRVPAFALIDGQKSIGGSAVGSNGEIAEMLQFAAAHKIFPRIEAFALKDVNDALARLRQNQMRYRAVLVIDG
jgi:uncharacterized zinc-type alcohol dehydrogenase-like protein